VLARVPERSGMQRNIDTSRVYQTGVVEVVGDRQARVRPYGVRKTKRLVSIDHLRKIKTDVGGSPAAVKQLIFTSSCPLRRLRM
jgi:hypothetical protein